MDVFRCCLKCKKLVQQSQIPVENYQFCESGHLYCENCIQTFNLKVCEICEEPLKFKENKTYFGV